MNQQSNQNNAGESPSGSARPGTYAPNRPLPRDEHGNPLPEPDAVGAHTQLGVRSGRNGPYTQAREFGADNKPVKDVDFTDHGRPDIHENPHQHTYEPNPTGGTAQRGPTEPLSTSNSEGASSSGSSTTSADEGD